MMRQWRLIYDKPLLGQRNMAIDDAILHAVSHGQAPPTLRLYAWEPACLSLGYGQRASDIDLARINERDWTVVRRPTGGKAILHTDELTYSLTLPDTHPIARLSIIESYRAISDALMIALNQLGLHPESNPKSANADTSGAVCFEVPSHYEITANHRKLVGSAQVRRRGGILQHGSLPLVGDIARICDVLSFADETERQQAKIKVRERATTLEYELQRIVSWQEAARAVINGFEQTFNVQCRLTQLSKAEIEHANELEISKYDHIVRTRG